MLNFFFEPLAVELYWISPHFFFFGFFFHYGKSFCEANLGLGGFLLLVFDASDKSYSFKKLLKGCHVLLCYIYNNSFCAMKTLFISFPLVFEAWIQSNFLFKIGFRNTNSQISAALTANGKYVVCASEDSHVYVWKHEAESRPNRSKGVTVTRSYEHFHCQDVSVATPWPGMAELWGSQDLCSEDLNGVHHHMDEASTANHPPTPVEEFNGNDSSPSASGCSNSPFRGTISSAPNSYFFDRISSTWPEEKLLLATKIRSPRVSLDYSNGVLQNRAAWGMVIVTAGLKGEIRAFQNFGLPVRI